MGCNPDYSCSRQAGKVVILILLGNVPRDEVTVGSLAPGQPVHDALLRNLSFEANLKIENNLNGLFK
jgi:hypothetical protein